MTKGKTVRKFIDVEMELDFNIKTVANNLSILKGKTITEKELLLQWIESGVKKSINKIKK